MKEIFKERRVIVLSISSRLFKSIKILHGSQC